jgi:hypothetical protein
MTALVDRKAETSDISDARQQDHPQRYHAA